MQQFIAQALRAVEAGQWTAHQDLAELAGTIAAEVAHFLASWKVQIPNAYRVLNADGSIPEEGMLNATYRGVDLRERLAKEGLAFDELGHAVKEQRLSAGALKELLDALREADSGAKSAPTAKRAWMVRGANVDWLQPRPAMGRLVGYVSLSASQLGKSSIRHQLRRAAAGGGNRVPAQVVRLPWSATRGARPLHPADA